MRLDSEPDAVLSCGSHFLIYGKPRPRVALRGVWFDFRAVPTGETPLACVGNVVVTVRYDDSNETTPWFIRSLEDDRIHESGVLRNDELMVSEAALTPRCVAFATAPDGPRPQRAWFACKGPGQRW